MPLCITSQKQKNSPSRCGELIYKIHLLGVIWHLESSHEWRLRYCYLPENYTMMAGIIFFGGSVVAQARYQQLQNENGCGKKSLRINDFRLWTHSSTVRVCFERMGALPTLITLHFYSPCNYCSARPSQPYSLKKTAQQETTSSHSCLQAVGRVEKTK